MPAEPEAAVRAEEADEHFLVVRLQEDYSAYACADCERPSWVPQSRLKEVARLKLTILCMECFAGRSAKANNIVRDQDPSGS